MKIHQLINSYNKLICASTYSVSVFAVVAAAELEQGLQLQPQVVALLAVFAEPIGSSTAPGLALVMYAASCPPEISWLECIATMIIIMLMIWYYSTLNHYHLIMYENSSISDVRCKLSS